MKSTIRLAIQSLPAGTTLKSICNGAGAMLLKKAAEKVDIEKEKIDSLLVKAKILAEEEDYLKEALDQEEEARLDAGINHLTLSPGIQKWKAALRPTVVFLLVILIAIGALIVYFQSLYNPQITLKINEKLFVLAKLALIIWFVSRGLEKLFNRN